MYGQFVREMPETVEKEKSWRLLGQGDLKVSSEALLRAAQEQAIRTNIDKIAESLLCRMCNENCETVQHIESECNRNIIDDTIM